MPAIAHQHKRYNKRRQNPQHNPQPRQITTRALSGHLKLLHTLPNPQGRATFLLTCGLILKIIFNRQTSTFHDNRTVLISFVTVVNGVLGVAVGVAYLALVAGVWGLDGAALGGAVGLGNVD